VSFLLLIPVMLSFLLLAAHFLRDGNLLLVGLCLALSVLLALRKPWAARIAQGALVVGAMVWLGTTVELVRLRMAHDMDWIRMAIILGTVTAVTGGSALLFQVGRLRRRYASRP